MVSFVNPAYASVTVVYGTYVEFMNILPSDISSLGMVYDLLLLILTIFGLWRMNSSSALWRTLIKQGVVYFALNLIANTILLVCSLANSWSR